MRSDLYSELKAFAAHRRESATQLFQVYLTPSEAGDLVRMVEQLRAERDYYRRRWLVHGLHVPFATGSAFSKEVKKRFARARERDV